MKSGRQQLIHDLLDADARREAILTAGSHILRRRRRWRVASRGIAVGLVLMLMGISLNRVNSARKVSTEMVGGIEVAPISTQRMELTDDELLDLFPDTPVGLATLSNGKKRLIFPRPGDEEKFITRL
jgi:hypothetical protein